jgi:hypothetical protein
MVPPSNFCIFALKESENLRSHHVLRLQKIRALLCVFSASAEMLGQIRLLRKQRRRRA